jgi:hypothetical protein
MGDARPSCRSGGNQRLTGDRLQGLDCGGASDTIDVELALLLKVRDPTRGGGGERTVGGQLLRGEGEGLAHSRLGALPEGGVEGSWVEVNLFQTYLKEANAFAAVSALQSHGLVDRQISLTEQKTGTKRAWQRKESFGVDRD